jgi:hypothetical protein
MSLKKRTTGEKVKLTVPDLSGESFRLQWTERQITKSYDKLLRRANGAIFFVHPATIVKPHRLDEVDALIAAQHESNLEGVSGAIGDAPEPLAKPWEIEKAATQVQLVELLQFILTRDYFRPAFRLAIVVSAWDLLIGLDTSPQEWFSTQLPMLQQFLGSNGHLFQTRFYGLSAQGAQYPSWRFVPGDIKNLKAFAKRVVQGLDPVSQWLQDAFDDSLRTALKEEPNRVTDSQELQTTLIERLNRLISAAVIYEPDRFAGVQLRPETEELRAAKDVQKGEETIRLNRLLLEDAFPSELSRDRRLNQDMAALQKKLPARRISLVGPNSELSNDITEPLQWLMK